MYGISDLTGTKRKATFGADPEVFLVDKDGNYVSAIGRFSGTKAAPEPIKSLGADFAFQVDNVLLEYNIPAVGSGAAWKQAHTRVLDWLNKHVAAQGLSIKIDASAEMPEKELIHPLSQVFGCEPDYDAWNMKINSSPKSKNPNLRSAGGHIHVGLPKMTPLQKITIVRIMDILLGSWATIADPDEKRKELYGRPGAMRFKDYGLEYRTISNFWLKDVKSINTAYILANHALHTFNETTFNGQHYKQTVAAMFRHNDKSVAQSLLSEFGVDLEDLPNVESGL